jgi:hypothetical protein
MDRGTASRGKYTLPKRAEFPTKVLEHLVNTSEKYPQSVKPEK